DWEQRMGRADWWVRTRIEASMTADAGNFRLRAELVATEGGPEGETEVFRRQFDQEVPRGMI
ncbi:MAG: hypothetical protein KDD81_13400, partial [Rhodobacteraceae bacterium]|nr:hypothetical protein [Paracoccaceae bacterium]